MSESQCGEERGLDVGGHGQQVWEEQDKQSFQEVEDKKVEQGE